MTATLEGYLLPLPPEERRLPVHISQLAPDSVFIPGIERPPRV
jgi:hypothetical protein